MSLQRDQKIGKARIVEFFKEPHTGLARIRETKNGEEYVFTVPCWLLELAAEGEKAKGDLD